MVRGAFLLGIFGAVMLVAIGITSAIGAQVTNNVQTGLTTGSVAWAAAGNATAGVGNLAQQLPNLGTVVGAAIILAVIFGVLIGAVAGKGRE